jgi:hypothetical protein
VQLAEGQPLLLAAKHWNGPGIGSWQVGGAFYCNVVLMIWVGGVFDGTYGLADQHRVA